jgi:ABC-type tungstate transport system permease subunit
LAALIQKEVGVEGPFPEFQAWSIEAGQSYVISKQFSVANERLFEFLLDQGSYIKYKFQDLENEPNSDETKLVVL